MSVTILTQSGAALFDAACQATLHASWLIMLVLSLQFLLKRWLTPNWRYALWLLVVLRLMLPVVPASSFSVFNLLARVSTAPSPVQVDVSRAVPPSLAIEPVTAQGWTTDNPTTATDPGRFQERLSLRYTAARVWLAGMASFLLILMRRHRTILSSLKVTPPLTDDRLQSLLASCQTALGVRKPIRIVETKLLSTPAIFGYRRPCLLLPASLHKSLADRELRLIFLHELMHIKRGDILFNWLLMGLQALHWFNPLVWLAFKRLRADRELVCDAQVLQRLGAEDRHYYGSTLIKLAEQFSPARLGPGLLPVINHQTEIKRRIIMIAKFKPTPRLVTLVSALLLVALGVFTLTRARPKEASKIKTDTRKNWVFTPDHPRPKEASDRTAKILEMELETLQDVVRKKQAVLDKLKVDLNISEDEAQGNSITPDKDTLRRLEAQRIEAEADFLQSNTILKTLEALKKDELRSAILIPTPDQLLGGLLERYSDAEQKLATLKSEFAEEHPEIKRIRSLLATTDAQINQRLDGMMLGMRTRVASIKARADAFAASAKNARAKDLATTERARPYFMAKRELETYQSVLETLRTRLLQEGIDHAIQAGR